MKKKFYRKETVEYFKSNTHCQLKYKPEKNLVFEEGLKTQFSCLSDKT